MRRRRPWHRSPTVPAKIDKSQLAIAEPKRLRDKAHLKFVASQPCLVCGRQPSDPHHLRFAQPRAIGLKVSDEFTVPLCRGHHREFHQAGNEEDWWENIRSTHLRSQNSFGSKTTFKERQYWHGQSRWRFAALMTFPDSRKTGLYMACKAFGIKKWIDFAMNCKLGLKRCRPTPQPSLSSTIAISPHSAPSRGAVSRNRSASRCRARCSSFPATRRAKISRSGSTPRNCASFRRLPMAPSLALESHSTLPSRPRRTSIQMSKICGDIL